MRDESLLFEADVTHRSGGQRGLSAVVGAVAAVALLGGVAAWTYRLGVRDAGDVPVIQALQGPVKVRPDDPGGEIAAHQDRAVYGLIGEAPPLPDPAPTARIDVEPLTAEDMPAAPPAAPDPAPAAPVEAVPADIVDQLVAQVMGETLAVAAAPPDPAALIDATPQAALAAPAPAPRPRAVALAAGPPTLGVQLGAYLSEADALTMWRGLRDRNPELLGDRTPDVSRLDGSARTLYRLRATPFASATQARGLCAALRARGEECIVVGTN